jgi:hypothetical protein
VSSSSLTTSPAAAVAAVLPADARHPQAQRAESRIAGHGLLATEAIEPGSAAVRFADAPADPGDLGLLNHSCDPNLGWADATTLVARRAIGAGEELTIDYATCVTDTDFVLYCHCETYRCRQVIEGTDWQIPQLQQRYAGHWHPAAQRLIESVGR